VGAKGILNGIRDGQLLFINGNEGYVIVEPDAPTKKELLKQI
jgi:phosphoenolpyruvate-protein kinase (PTS system EI component)